MRLVGVGLTNAQIVQRLVLGEATVKTHVLRKCRRRYSWRCPDGRAGERAGALSGRLSPPIVLICAGATARTGRAGQAPGRAAPHRSAGGRRACGRGCADGS
ncbi:hypothetical protein [Micromonospora avicenniae]|uniref:hypothetical protein n=1 Tax=Micromonospora avicenniae TaxID=1198245 RepID=UPI0033212FF2